MPELKTENVTLKNLSLACGFMLASLPGIAQSPEIEATAKTEPTPVTRPIDNSLDPSTLPVRQEASNEEIRSKNSQNLSTDSNSDYTIKVEVHEIVKSSWTKIGEFFDSWTGKVTSATILAALGLLAAFRGIVKGSWEANLIVKGLRAFSARDFTKYTNLNVYYFREGPDGEPLLRPVTKAHILTASLFPTLGHQRHFMKAARQCTETQGIVSLEFPRDSESLTARMSQLLKPAYLALYGLGYAISLGQWKPCENLLKKPDERYTALNRVNKALREVISPYYNENKADYAQFAERLGLEVVVEQVIIIPFCDVGSNNHSASHGNNKSRSLVLISLTKSDAKKFRKDDILPTIQIDGNTLPEDRPQQIHDALKERSRYRKMFKDSYEKRQELFPVVDVLFLKRKGSDQLLMPFHELATDDSGATTALLKELLLQNTAVLEALQQTLTQINQSTPVTTTS